MVDVFRQFAVLDEGSAAKRFTDEVFELDRASLAAVLRGLFTADGTVADYGDEDAVRRARQRSSETLLQQVQLLLLAFGIKSKLYADRRAADDRAAARRQGRPPRVPGAAMYTLRISRSSRFVFEREIGFLAESPKAAHLARAQRARSALPRRAHRLASLPRAARREMVYDLTEPATHHFVADGLVVHNCSEYMFLDDTACNLASINLVKFLRADGTLRHRGLSATPCRLWTIVLEI